MVDKFTKKQKKLYKITVTLKVKDDRVKMLATYITDLKVGKNKLIDFDDGLVYVLVDKVIVNKDKIIVKWRDGTEGEKGLIFYLEILVYLELKICYNALYEFYREK